MVKFSWPKQTCVKKIIWPKQLLVQIVIAVVILVSGIIIGSGTTILLAKNRMIWIKPPNKPNAASIAHKISEKYGLDQQQATQMEKIFVDGFAARKLLRDEMDKKMDTQTEVFIEKMKQAMTAEQFDRWYKDFQKMMESRKKRHH
ncbi:MAG: hypothetical protein PHF37_03610 [Phycisphaerae bacterium]|nr:hypothetical protein [Phycisphaerae bacterium]